MSLHDNMLIVLSVSLARANQSIQRAWQYPEHEQFDQRGEDTCSGGGVRAKQAK